MDLAQTLKDFRAANSLEQEDLAKLLETTQQTVSNWEGGTMPRSGALKRINHLLATYKQGELPLPWVPSPKLNPAITEIHEVPVQEQMQFARYSKSRAEPELGEGRIKTEYETRRAVAESLGSIAGEHPVTFERDFMQQLADHLPVTRQFEIQAAVDYQGLRMRADYLSAKVCAEFKMNARMMSIFPIELGIHQLSTLRRIFERKGEPRVVYVLFIVTKDPEHRPRILNRILTSATLHDVHVFIVHTPEECAQMIEELETGKYEDYEDYL